MMRGFLSGLTWGGLLAGVSVVALSISTPLPSRVSPQTEPTATPEAPQAAGDGSVLGAPSAQDAAPGVDFIARAPGAAVTPDALPDSNEDTAPRPVTATPEADLSAPALSAAEGGIDVAVVTPVLPNPQARGIATPAEEPELSISTNPAQPPLPEAEEEEAPVVAGDTPPDEAQEDNAAGPKTVTLPESAGAVLVEAPDEGVASLMKPAADLKESFPQHQSDRLPTISTEAEAAALETAAAPAMALPPLEAFAAAFDNPENKPLLSVVLMVGPDAAIDPEVLTNFPLPLTFAIDGATAEATAQMRAARDLGFEVTALVDLPEAATPADAEVTLGAQLAALPEAVAVIEGQGAGLQSSRALSDQVTAALLESGHGLVFLQNGLDTAQKLAVREGVAAASVFRDFDSKGQSVDVIRRFFDQAAFKARQQGGVIMLGRLREETLSALALWALQDRASTVALAPLSALLRSAQ